MPPIMANSKTWLKSQDHKDKYFDNSRKIFPQDMTTIYDHLYCGSFIFYFLEVMTNDTDGHILWSYLESKISNTIINFEKESISLIFLSKNWSI